VAPRRPTAASALVTEELTYRRLDYWTRQGYLIADNANAGPGNRRIWSESEKQIARLMIRLVKAGLTVSVAATVARAGGVGVIGPGIRVAVEGSAPAIVEAAEIARGRIYDRWKASDDLSTAAVRRLIRDAFEAGERHQEAWESSRVAERAWIAPDDVPVEQR
jgi:hypothetical protein